MSHERVIWTALPNGLAVVGGKTYLKLTAAVSPRCYDGLDVLSDYSYFLTWPATLAGATFDVVFHGSGGAVVAGAKRDPASPAADSTKWGYLFTRATPVKPYSFPDLSKRFVINDPAAATYDFVKAQYQSIIATFPDSLPNAINPKPGSATPNLVSSLVDPNFPDGFPTLADLQSSLDVAKKEKRRTLPAAATGLAALSQLSLFYQREWKRVSPFPTTPQTLDFHEQVSALARFGELQRYLGLAVDLLVPFSSAIPTAGATTIQLKSPVLVGTSVDDICPRTHYTLDANDFRAASRTGQTKSGMLDLTDTSAFNLVQLDTDGAGLRLIGLVKRLLSSKDFLAETQARTGEPQPIGLPSLRSGGLAILQTGRDAALAQITANAMSANAQAESGGGGSLDFYAEDLTRGFRVDVWDSFTGAWHSLHERGPAIDPKDPANQVPPKKLPGSYVFTNAPAGSRYFVPTGVDEGFVSPGVTQDPNGPSSGGESPDLYQHELLWRWLGWSLSGQRPTKYLDGHDSPTQYGDRPSDEEPGPGVALVTHFGAAAGSLPKLRFGRQYRMRARVVDLSGNSVDPTSNLDDYEVPKKGTSPLTYRRFEPVVTPALIPHDDLSVYDKSTSQLVGSSPGESSQRLVLRSNYDKTSEEELAFLSGTGSGQLGHIHLPPETTRWIVPPQISELMAEQHGLFDQGSGWRADALHIMTTYDSSFGTETLPDGTTIPSARGGTKLPMPYLSDILAAGASFAGLPGAPKPVYGPAGTLGRAGQSLSFSGTWPDLQPFRLTLNGIDSGSKAPVWDATNRVLTVFVAKGDVTSVRLSSFILPKTLDLLGIWGWMEEYRAAGKITAARLQFMLDSALAGVMWALTPFQRLTFVNAVQQPLIQPQFLKLLSQRTVLGQTDALLLADPMPIDGPSTVKVDVTAHWTDPRDDVSLDPCPQPNATVAGVVVPGLPKEIKSSQHVLELPVSPGTTEIRFDTAANYRHKFGDTKHRFVDYTATATTRFLEYFPKDARIETTRVSPVARVNILSSARPKSPNILYAVPAFGWTTTQSGNLTQSDRAGGRLRVYFDRPFYSSGEGELLGIVLINDAGQVDTVHQGRLRRILSARGLAGRDDAAGVTTVLEKYVTQWGMDPLWSSPGIANPPMVTDFPAAATNQNLFLEELGGIHGNIPVGVAGFPVTYDSDRCLYFADLKFSWGNSYFPFVRLALAAYQPFSMSTPDTVHLSRVIMTDFVQLAPDRTALIQTHTDSSNAKFVKVSVTGVTYNNTAGAGAQVEVTLEQPAPEVQSPPGELSWVPVPHADYTLTPNKATGSDVTVWSGGFDLPHPAGSTPYRLIVREYEFYAREWGDFQPNPKASDDRATPDSIVEHAASPAGFRPPVGYDKRLVYAATLQI